MADLSSDPRPWFCVTCSDRFAREQPRVQHHTIWKPRSSAPTGTTEASDD